MMYRRLTIILTIAMSLVLILTTFLVAANPDSTYAKELKLIGKEVGLVVEPSGETLFNLDDMNPGDTEIGTFKISNSYRYPFNLYMKAEELEEVITAEMENPGEFSLFDQLKLKVTYKGEVLFDDYMEYFARGNNISLGRFQPGDIQDLTAEVHLRGPETGNEYEGMGAKVKWVFTAQSIIPPSNDYTPTTPVIPEVEVPDEDTPQGQPDTPTEPDTPTQPEVPSENTNPTEDVDPEVEVIEEDIPQGTPEMPKTGENIPVILYSVGTLAILLGLMLMYSRKAKLRD